LALVIYAWLLARASLTTTSSVCSLLSVPSERINRDALDLVHRSYPAHRLDPRDSQFHRVPEGKGPSPASNTRFRVLEQMSSLQIWGVGLIWWSVWLSVAWGGTIISVLFQNVLVFMIRKIFRLVGQSCGSVRRIRNSETIVTGSQRDFYHYQDDSSPHSTAHYRRCRGRCPSLH
jgi:hypothetical protein